MKEFFLHECDFTVPTLEALENPLPVKFKGVIVDRASSLKANPLERFPRKCSGCLSFDATETETACKEDRSSNEVGCYPEPSRLHPDHPNAEHLLDPNLVEHITILPPDLVLDRSDRLILRVFDLLQLVVQGDQHLMIDMISHHPHQTGKHNNVQNFQLIWHLVLVTDVVHGRSNWSPRLIKGDPVGMEVRQSNDDQQM